MTQDKTAQFLMDFLIGLGVTAVILSGCAIAAYFLDWYGQW